MRRSRRIAPTLVALVAGGLQAVSLAAPWNGQPLWWLQLLSVALLGWQLKRCADRELSWSSSTWTGNADRPSTVAQAGWLGWVFGCSWLTGTFWWLYISMHTYGGLAAPLAAAAVLGLGAALALFYALACAIFMAILRPLPHVNSGFRAILFAALWTAAELARGSWFTGFPWGAGGYAHADGLLAGYAPWIGVYGLGAVAAWVGMTLPRLLHCGVGSRVALVFLLALPSVAQVGNPASTRAVGTLAVTLLQGNIPQDEKFQPGTGVPQALKWYAEQLRDAKTPLVVGPETAVPLLPQQLPEGYWAALQQRFASGNQAALLGVPLGDITVGYTNSVVGLKPGQAEPYRYDKHHLVPFGEFIPPLFKWFTAMMNIPLGDFNRGELGAPSFEWQGQRLAPNICYEDLFGEELATRFADPATAPTILVNLSNIGWFGNTVAIDQHLQISRMRALEFERPMLRATNTGPTVFIDHRGQVTRELPRLTRGALLGEVEGRDGLTPYARWVSRFGLWPLWVLAGLLVGLALLVRRRN
ncbi:MAG: apolipoprotein N-acyltransferase [Burkholderiales bacterium]|nr:apolipoprotein N-acyltransferase [Burkholderiales bacterium]